MEIIFRGAQKTDAPQIALLHAENWRKTYRGILLDEFLDGDIFENRKNLWEQRLTRPPANQFICAAFEHQKLAGFVCVFGENDPKWGSLIDNLHVAEASRGHGIGKKLMKNAANWVNENYPKNGFYLWVYEKNASARRFYENLGAATPEMIVKENPGGGSANSIRCVWAKGASFE